MDKMGQLPPGMPSMSQGSDARFPRQRMRPLAFQPRMHTPYNLAVPGRKLKQRGRAVIDANPYKTSLKSLQRGTNLPVQLIGGEVRGHGASKAGRAARKQMGQQEMIDKALRNANKAPREVNVAGVQDNNPIVNQDQFDDNQLAQIEKIKDQVAKQKANRDNTTIAGVTGSKGDTGQMGDSGMGSGGSQGSGGIPEEDPIDLNRRLNKEMGIGTKTKKKKAKKPQLTRKAIPPRVYMPVLDYRRKRYPF